MQSTEISHLVSNVQITEKDNTSKDAASSNTKSSKEPNAFEPINLMNFVYQKQDAFDRSSEVTLEAVEFVENMCFYVNLQGYILIIV